MRALIFLLLFICLTAAATRPPAPAPWDEVNLKQLREEVRAMFRFAWGSYKRYGFPFDEVKPLSCKGADPFGGYSTTIVDALDTLVVMGMRSEFEEAVWWLRDNLSFDKDRNVSVFETNIRMMGGLLSAHLFASDSPFALAGYFATAFVCDCDGDFGIYDGSLLALAEDLAQRLLPAFDTPTGIPYGTVNLRHGVPVNESQFTCLAGAGTFSLEFGLLSRLTGNPHYEQLARNAVDAMWRKRTPLNLLGTHINIMTGEWSQREAQVGAGADSFYEYLLKAALLFGNGHYMHLFEETYDAILRYVRHRTGWYLSAQIDTGALSNVLFDSLQGFWPALQVLYGDVESAAHTLRQFLTLVHRWGVPPELFNLQTGQLVRPSYPLRPELAESLYYISQATSDPVWLRFGRDLVKALQTITRVPCGFASVKNVETRELEDHMDSYFLAETLKYLFLLFDRNNFVTVGNYIFNTEGHPYRMDLSYHSWAETLPHYYKYLHLNATAAPLSSLLFSLRHDEFQARLAVSFSDAARGSCRASAPSLFFVTSDSAPLAKALHFIPANMQSATNIYEQ